MSREAFDQIVERQVNDRLAEVKRALFASALDCIIIIDADGRVLEFSPAAEKTFGYTRDEVIGGWLIITRPRRSSTRQAD